MHPLTTTFTTAFLEDPALDSTGSQIHHPACQQASSPWWYSAADGESPEAFARSNRFERFADNLKDRIATLVDVLGARSDESAALGQFQRHMLDVDSAGVNRHFGDSARSVYAEGAEYLDRLVAHIGNPHVTSDACVTELRELAPSLTACGAGAVDSLQRSMTRLDPNRRGLRGKCRSLIERSIEQVAVEAVERRYAKSLEMAPGSHRHYVSGLQTHLYKGLGLKWRAPEDPMAKRNFDPSTVEGGLQRISAVLTPGNLALTLAEEYLARCGEAIPGAAARRADEPLTICAIDAGTQILFPEFNATPAMDALVRVDAEVGSCVLQSDPVAIGVHFLHKLSNAEVIHPASDAPVAEWNAADGEPVRYFVVGELAWVTEGGSPRALVAADLPWLAKLTSAPLNAAALRSIALASAPAELATHFEPGLLRDAGVCSWLCGQLDDAQLTPLLNNWHCRQACTPEQFSWIADALAHDGRFDVLDKLPVDRPLDRRLESITRALQARPPKLQADRLREVLATNVGDSRSLLEHGLLNADLSLCARLLEELVVQARLDTIDPDSVRCVFAQDDHIWRRLRPSPGAQRALLSLQMYFALQQADRRQYSPRKMAAFLLPQTSDGVPREVDANDPKMIMIAALAAEAIGHFPWKGDRQLGRATLRALLEAETDHPSSRLLARCATSDEDAFMALLAESLKAMRRLSFSPGEAMDLLNLPDTGGYSTSRGKAMSEIARIIGAAPDAEELPEEIEHLVSYQLATDRR